MIIFEPILCQFILSKTFNILFLAIVDQNDCLNNACLFCYSLSSYHFCLEKMRSLLFFVVLFLSFSISIVILLFVLLVANFRPCPPVTDWFLLLPMPQLHSSFFLPFSAFFLSFLEKNRVNLAHCEKRVQHSIIV